MASGMPKEAKMLLAIGLVVVFFLVLGGGLAVRRLGTM